MRWPLKRQITRLRSPVVGVLTIVVIGWWLLLGSAIVLVMPGAELFALPTPRSTLIGQPARIHQADQWQWVIPVERAAFDAAQRGAVEQTVVHDAWLTVKDGQLVRIVAVDGAAVQVELLEGTSSGRRGWARQRDLGPVD